MWYKSKVARDGTCIIRIEVEVEAARVREEVEGAFSVVQSRARVPGFRPGRAPAGLVRREFSERVKEEVIGRLVPASLGAVLDEHRLDEVAPPRVQDVAFGPDQPMTFTALVEVRPQVDIKDYKKLRLERKAVPVTEEKIAEVLEDLREKSSRLVEDPGQVVSPASHVLVVIREYKNGKPAPGSRNRETMVDLSASTLPPGFAGELAGARAGEARDVTVSEAGKPMTLHVRVKSVRQKQVPPLDDELAREYGAATLDELRKNVREQLGAQAEQESRRALEEQVVDRLIESNPIPLPPSLVEDRMRALVERTVTSLARQGLGLSVSEESRQKLRERFQAEAERQVRAAFLLSAVAAKEGIQAAEEEIRREVERAVQSAGGKPGDAAAALERHRGRVGASLRESKVLAFLIQHAKLTETQGGR